MSQCACLIPWVASQLIALCIAEDKIIMKKKLLRLKLNGPPPEIIKSENDDRFLESTRKEVAVIFRKCLQYS